ncbi:hypothetical protein QUF70_00830 [Desulfobacterales bacterium HSG17]|nr:hypothetical protein [Desulfobacterales bacterium HSG17]
MAYFVLEHFHMLFYIEKGHEEEQQLQLQPQVFKRRCKFSKFFK